MTDRERMAALAKTLKRLSDELHAAGYEFSTLGWGGHASETVCWASHASIYSHQLEARAVEILQNRDAYFGGLRKKGVKT